MYNLLDLLLKSCMHTPSAFYPVCVPLRQLVLQTASSVNVSCCTPTCMVLLCRSISASTLVKALQTNFCLGCWLSLILKLTCIYRSGRPYLEEPRNVIVHKGAEPLGISIVSGENGGIFVSKVTGGSIAHQAGLEYGDQLLEVSFSTSITQMGFERKGWKKGLPMSNF